MKSIILATVFTITSFNAMAIELVKPIEPIVKTNQSIENVVSSNSASATVKAKRVTVPMTAEQITAIATMIKPVCDLQNSITLSKEAIAACNGDEKKLPKLNKKGDKLTKGKTGGEFITLLANIDAFN